MSFSQQQKLMDEIEELISTYQFEEAIVMLVNANNQYPNDTHFIDIYADISLQLGDIDKAKELLLKSIELDPNNGASKFMNLGQITGGMESVQCYQKGIEIVNNEKNLFLSLNNQNTENYVEIRNFNNIIISGLCSIAEIYMTDECDAEKAEQECERILMEAINLDDKNYEVLQLIGSFKISQNKKDEAISFLLKSKDNWNQFDEGPTPEVKVNFVKLLLELEQFDASSQILEELIEENEHDSEFWYLYAFSLLPIDPIEAKLSIEKCCELLTSQGLNDPNIISQVEDLNEKITTSIKNLPEEEKIEMDAYDEENMEENIEENIEEMETI